MYHNFIKSLCHLIRLGFTYKSVLAIISFYQDALVSLLIYYKFCVFAFHFNARKLIQTFFKHRVNSVNQLFMIFLKHTLASQSLWLWSLVFHKVLRRPAPHGLFLLFLCASLLGRTQLEEDELPWTALYFFQRFFRVKDSSLSRQIVVYFNWASFLVLAGNFRLSLFLSFDWFGGPKSQHTH